MGTDQNVVTDYGWQSAHEPCSAGYIVPTILRLLSQLKPRRVLDLGSGNGKLCAEMSVAGYDAVGVEYDQTGVDVARKEYPHLRFYRFSTHDDPTELLRQEPSSFDVVVSTEVIEHLYAPHMLAQYARQLLVSDGYLIVTTPYHGYLKNLALSVFDKWDFHHSPLWHGGHIKFWSRKTLSRLLQENGFEVIRFLGIGRLPYIWKSMALVARKNEQPVVPSGA